MKRFGLILRLLISGGLTYWLYRQYNWDTFLTSVQGASIPLLGLAFALLLLNSTISAFKWRILLKADGVHVPLTRLLSSYLIGSFLNFFLPSNIGGDSYRIFDISRLGRASKSAASVLADRLSGFIALVLIAFAGGLLGLRHMPDSSVFIIPALALAGLTTGVFLLLQRTWLLRLVSLPPLRRWAKARGFIEGVLESVATYRSHPGLFLKILSLSFAFQLVAVVFVGVIARALGWTIEWTYFLYFVPFIALMEAVPVTINGLGVRDGFYAYFFNSLALGPGQDGKHLALAYVFVTLIYCSSGGILLATRRHRAEPHA